MASSGSEGIPYDDDFEEASDDDGRPKTGVLRRNASKASSHKKEEASTPHTVAAQSCQAGGSVIAPTQVVEARDLQPTAGAGGQASAMENSSRPGSRPGRRRQGDDAKAKTPTKVATVEEAPLEMNSQPPVEMNTSGASFTSVGGRRQVRGKVSVGNTDELVDRRPGTNDSTGKASARPIWLQSDESRPLPRHMSPAQGIQSGPRARSGGPVFNPPAVASGRGRPPIDPDLDGDGRLGTAADDDRKVKRLQQEVQRLTNRLKETELYSAQDEGLPLFTLGEVEVGCQIGQGGFCAVFQGTWRSTPCAVKKIFDPVITNELKAEFENEVRMLRRLRHPNVITIMAICRVPPALSIMTELLGGGSLFELLHGPPQAKRPDSIDCEPPFLLPVMQQTATALVYLHAMLMVHRDVKSHNLLLTTGRSPVAKLCDFGLARLISELCTGTMQWAGTACYMAPELFAKRRYTEAVDIFAFGVMLWETMSTEIPHANLEAADIAHRVQSKDGAGLPVQHGWPKSLKALLRTSMAVKFEERPSMISVGEQLQQIVMEFPLPD